MDRDEVVIKHFASRSKQPKVLAAGPVAAAAERGVSAINVYLVYDQNLNNALNQIDDTRFRHIGTSPVMCRNRNLLYETMKSTFDH